MRAELVWGLATLDDRSQAAVIEPPDRMSPDGPAQVATERERQANARDKLRQALASARPRADGLRAQARVAPFFSAIPIGSGQRCLDFLRSS
jgi:hypothetical protein